MKNTIWILLIIAIVALFYFKPSLVEPIIYQACWEVGPDCPDDYTCYVKIGTSITDGLGDKCVHNNVDLEPKICGGFANAKCSQGYECSYVPGADYGVCYKWN